MFSTTDAAFASSRDISECFLSTWTCIFFACSLFMAASLLWPDMSRYSFFEIFCTSGGLSRPSFFMDFTSSDMFSLSSFLACASFHTVICFRGISRITYDIFGTNFFANSVLLRPDVS